MPDTHLQLHPVARLFDAHGNWLQAWLGRRLGCRELASDLAQDTFVKVLRAGTDAASLQEPRAYLVTIARRLLANHYRRHSLEQAWLEALRGLPEARAPSEEERWVVLETLHLLDEVLDALPARVRRTFLLSQLEGMTYPGIAERSGVSVRTVKRDMASAFVHCLKVLG
ncbi:sigma-70 family RNA polymerase sigma factor [Lysobacter pythonis]|uniref:Sigma-70 family RNA polymerase sigma factor n=1 Tax=Solilutibacter pythonis TaxID=2483112 RepID=A0A3M2I3Q3_9GAMM|nr:sigma-70 family RNA polymerase sigma factor [Lysobacter pythonis]RMH92854.1 sigma-70 family RNA polymerase sigma factor [Lysobacter pythonis]